MPLGDRAVAAAIPINPAPRERLQDHVYQRIKDLILNGEIEPGQSITIESLAQAFAVSHMPVREALRRLTAERALTVVTGRSMGIAQLSTERLADLRRVRCEVEGLAAAWAAEKITEPILEHLDDLNDTLDLAVKESDVRAYLRANRDFHFAIYDAAGSPTLLSMIESLWLQISPYFNLLHVSGNYIEANEQHRALADALRRHDQDAARTAIQADICAAAASLQSLVK